MNLLAIMTAEAVGNALGIGVGLFLVFRLFHGIGRALVKRFPEAWLGITLGTTFLTILVIGLTVALLTLTKLTSTELIVGVTIFFFFHLANLTLTAWRSWRQPDAGHADLPSSS